MVMFVQLKLGYGKQTVIRGTQRIILVNYLFGRPLIPYDFLH